MLRWKGLKKFLMMGVVLLLLVLVLQQLVVPSGWSFILAASESMEEPTTEPPRLCPKAPDCPGDHLSFHIQSGAASVVAPKMCLESELVLGSVLNNAGYGINIVIVDGRSGDVLDSNHFDMYRGDVAPLIKLLKSIPDRSIVLMASYDDPASKLTDEARSLISELGSSSINLLKFRDNWVFAGGKGVNVKSSFEKYLKNDNVKNKYENWPELVELDGCIPKHLG